MQSLVKQSLAKQSLAKQCLEGSGRTFGPGRLPGQRGRQGRSWWEVLLVTCLVLALAIVLLPLLVRMRSSSRRLHCERRQIELTRAVLRFEAFRGGFPGFRSAWDDDALADTPPRPQSWAWQSLAFIAFDDQEQTAGPYRAVEEAYEAGGTRAGKMPDERIPEFLCPAITGPRSGPLLDLVVNTGMPDVAGGGEIPPDWAANGLLLDHFRVRPEGTLWQTPWTLKALEDADGADFTVLLSENVDAGNWTDSREPLLGFQWSVADDDVPDGTSNAASPANADAPASRASPDAGPGGKELAVRVLGINREVGKGDGSARFARPASYHAGGVNVTFASGRTAFVAQDIDPLAWIGQLTPGGTAVRRAGSQQFLPPPYRRPAGAASAGSLGVDSGPGER